MAINWPEKNTTELELYFSTDVKQGLTREQYLESKKQYGENIIGSDILEKQNFYGLRRKKRNTKAMVSGSVGISGVLYFLVAVILRLMNPEVNIYLLLPFYALLAAAAFILCASSEEKYEEIYKAARPKALVIRDGKRQKKSIENIVPGDLIPLSAGDIVPADARIVSADNLSCVFRGADGSPVRAPKTSRPRPPDSFPGNNKNEPAENIAYAADIIEQGSAFAIVIATGYQTRIAGLADMHENQGGRKETETDTEIKTETETETRSGRSFVQRRALEISKGLFLASVVLSMLVIFAGIIQGRDFYVLIMTCAAAMAACFPEQIAIIADFAVLSKMRALSKSTGISIKKTSTVDEINDIDTLIAKKTESFTQDRIKLALISGFGEGGFSDFNAEAGNLHATGYALSCMALCANVTRLRSTDNKINYSGSAVDVAVFEALDRCGLSSDGINQAYQKFGRTIYDPAKSIKSAVVSKDGAISLVCFGEAFNIIAGCAGNAGVLRAKAGSLYKEYDLVMAVASKKLSHANISSDADINANLSFAGFACFSEPKTNAVFQSIDSLKKSGVEQVMIAESDNIHARSAAVKFGIIPSADSARVLSDAAAQNMNEGMFFIESDKVRMIAQLSLENKIKFLRALKFRKKFPAVTINDVEEISLLNDQSLCASFTSVNTETGILKNKASVIAKNLTVSTVLKTIKHAVLIYRNACEVMYFSSVIFASQYFLVLFAVLLGGAFILSPVQIIWTGAGAGFMLAASLCFSEENRGWQVLRKKIKEYKSPGKFNGAVLKYGFICGFFIFAFTVISFFACLAIEAGMSASGAAGGYISSGLADMSAPQTAAFLTYIIAAAGAGTPRISRASDITGNKFFIAAAVLNAAGILCAVFIPAVRNFAGFGDPGRLALGASVIAGLCPWVISRLLKRKIFFA
jgi:Ca2+-transporting ATPase